MKNSVRYKKELQAIKELVISQINSYMSSKDFEVVTVEDLEEGDYEQNHLTLRNDYGEVYDVLIVGVKNGNLLTYNENKEDYEFDITPLGDIDSTDDLILLLELLEDNYLEVETSTDFKIGDTVIVADPKPRDLWNHSFVGEIIGIFEALNYCKVVDGDGDVWDVDFDQLEKQDD